MSPQYVDFPRQLIVEPPCWYNNEIISGRQYPKFIFTKIQHCVTRYADIVELIQS